MSFGDFVYRNSSIYKNRNNWVLNHSKQYGSKILGYDQYKNTQASLKAQMDYENYLKAGNERALSDWYKNLPGRTIKYPEFSYEGQIVRANTSFARAMYDYDTAYSNFVGNLPYRVAGLYGIGGKISRML